MKREWSPKDKAIPRPKKSKIFYRHKGGNSPDETLLDASLVSLLLLGLHADSMFLLRVNEMMQSALAPYCPNECAPSVLFVVVFESALWLRRAPGCLMHVCLTLDFFIVALFSPTKNTI